MTPAQIKYVRGLLVSYGLQEQKEALVLEYTEGRTEHLTEMNHQETERLINGLTGGSSRSRQVRKILSMAHEMGWESSGGKVDMNRVNAWCSKYSAPHKPLDALSETELPAVVTTFTKVYKSFLKGL